MKKPIPTVAFAFAAVLWSGAAAPAQAQERTGTSVSDQAVTYGMFIVNNPTAHTITYEIKLGKGAWKSFTLRRGEAYEHSYKGNAKGELLSSPYIRFDRVRNRIDGEPWYHEYELYVSVVVKGGFGPKEKTGALKTYDFKESANGRSLDLYRRK